MIDDAFFAFQVRRADFDKILLDHSEDSRRGRVGGNSGHGHHRRWVGA